MNTESTRWSRSEQVPFPSVWMRFKGRKEINGVLPSFWVQDIPEDEFENVVNCMIERFCEDAPLPKYSRLLKDLESVNSMRKLWSDVLRDKTGLICYMENPEPNGNPIFVGVNCTHIKSICDEKLKLSGKAFEQVLGTLKLATDHTDVFNFLGTNTLLSGLGLYVLPEYRGQGIGFEILLARKQMCEALGIKAAVTLFSSSISQGLAEKAGYKSLYEISYRDLRDIHKYDYPGVEEKHKFVKYMYIVY